MIGVLRWEEPPPRRRESGTAMYEAMAAELRAAPGRWAVVREGTRATVLAHGTQIVTGKIAAFRPAGSFEATSRTVDGKTTIYARYVGGAS